MRPICSFKCICQLKLGGLIAHQIGRDQQSHLTFVTLTKHGNTGNTLLTGIPKHLSLQRAVGYAVVLTH